MRALLLTAILLLAAGANAADLTLAARVHAAIAAVCPIQGVSIGDANDKSTWKIAFGNNVTPEQKVAAEQAIKNFDTTPPEAPKSVEEEIEDLRSEIESLKAGAK